MIRHFVGLRFKANATDHMKSDLMRDLSKVAGNFEGVIDFQVRANVSVEDALVRGFRDVYWWDFRDLSVRDTYLGDPGHHEVGARLLDVLEGGPDGLVVFEFEV